MQIHCGTTYTCTVAFTVDASTKLALNVNVFLFFFFLLAKNAAASDMVFFFVGRYSKGQFDAMIDDDSSGLSNVQDRYVGVASASFPYQRMA